MTTPEHTLVSIHLAIAAGLHRHLGWRVIALAGVAANIPDLDGVPMLFNMHRFESGHRVWGHNVWAVLVTSVLLAVSQYRWDWLGQVYTWYGKTYHQNQHEANSSSYLSSGTRPAHRGSWLILTTVALVSQAVHLPCDMVVSGGTGFSDWPVRPFWPASDIGYVCPLISWGDIGPTVVLMAGVILIAKWPTTARLFSAGTLVVLTLYLALGGFGSLFA
ncbi:MAG: metal-dependent hydrolase [Planctomycetaceae bacterium]|nr:metal-dependent hydrolase [Planctomycetaceae bacterium]